MVDRAETKPRRLGYDRGYNIGVMRLDCRQFRAEREFLRFAREAQQNVDFNAVGEFYVFEEIEDAAAETGANFADVAGGRGRARG